MHSTKKERLQPYYLMIVLAYIDDIDDLVNFNCVSRHCQEAIDATRVNPLCGILTIKTALTLSEERIHHVEMKMFNHLDRFKVHFRVAEKMHTADCLLCWFLESLTCS